MPTASAASTTNPSLNTSRVEPTMARTVLASTGALAAATVAERGLVFVANLLAARIGGVATYGAYSLAMTTAHSVASYAGAGIGSTAARFSGEYRYESRNYGPFTLALLLVSCTSAVLALGGLLVGAAPLARLMRNEDLARLLQWAALSAAAILLLECCRGFLVGQRRFSALLFLSVATGAGMAALLPILSRTGPTAMIIGQSIVVLLSLGACVAFGRRFGFAPGAGREPSEQVLRVARKIWAFGGVQLASLAGLSAAGWWVASMVARGDNSMVQMGLFAVATQLRNIAALGPGLLTQGNYALMTENASEPDGMPDRVMVYCSFLATLSGFLLAGAGILLLPWMLPMIYGPQYSGAALPAALALSTAVIHMGAAPLAARLSIVSLRLTGIINAGWTVLVIVLAMPLVPSGGATAATAIYFMAHLASATAVLGALRRRRALPQGMLPVFLLCAAGSIGLALASWLRAIQPQRSMYWTAALAIFAGAVVTTLIITGRRHRWVPAKLRWRSLAYLAKPGAPR